MSKLDTARDFLSRLGGLSPEDAGRLGLDSITHQKLKNLHSIDNVDELLAAARAIDGIPETIQDLLTKVGSDEFSSYENVKAFVDQHSLAPSDEMFKLAGEVFADNLSIRFENLGSVYQDLGDDLIEAKRLVDETAAKLPPANLSNEKIEQTAYFISQGGFEYTDRTGEVIKVTSGTEAENWENAQKAIFADLYRDHDAAQKYLETVTSLRNNIRARADLNLSRQSDARSGAGEILQMEKQRQADRLRGMTAVLADDLEAQHDIIQRELALDLISPQEALTRARALDANANPALGTPNPAAAPTGAAPTPAATPAPTPGAAAAARTAEDGETLVDDAADAAVDAADDAKKLEGAARAAAIAKGPILELPTKRRRDVLNTWVKMGTKMTGEEFTNIKAKYFPVNSRAITNPIIHQVDQILNPAEGFSFTKKIQELDDKIRNIPQPGKSLDQIEAEIKVAMEEFATTNADDLKALQDQLTSVRLQIEDLVNNKKIYNKDADGRFVGLDPRQHAALVAYAKDLENVAADLQKADFGKQGAHISDMKIDASDTRAPEHFMDRILWLANDAERRMNHHSVDALKNSNLEKAEPEQVYQALERSIDVGYYNPHRSRVPGGASDINLEKTWENGETEYLGLAEKSEDGKVTKVNWPATANQDWVTRMEEFAGSNMDHEAVYLQRNLGFRMGKDAKNEIASFPRGYIAEMKKSERYTTDPHYAYWVDHLSHHADTKNLGGGGPIRERRAREWWAKKSYEIRDSFRYRGTNTETAILARKADPPNTGQIKEKILPLATPGREMIARAGRNLFQERIIRHIYGATPVQLEDQAGAWQYYWRPWKNDFGINARSEAGQGALRNTATTLLQQVHRRSTAFVTDPVGYLVKGGWQNIRGPLWYGTKYALPGTMIVRGEGAKMKFLGVGIAAAWGMTGYAIFNSIMDNPNQEHIDSAFEDVVATIPGLEGENNPIRDELLDLEGPALIAALLSGPTDTQIWLDNARIRALEDGEFSPETAALINSDAFKANITALGSHHEFLDSLAEGILEGDLNLTELRAAYPETPAALLAIAATQQARIDAEIAAAEAEAARAEREGGEQPSGPREGFGNGRTPVGGETPASGSPPASGTPPAGGGSTGAPGGNIPMWIPLTQTIKIDTNGDGTPDTDVQTMYISADGSQVRYTDPNDPTQEKTADKADTSLSDDRSPGAIAAEQTRQAALEKARNNGNGSNNGGGSDPDRRLFTDIPLAESADSMVRMTGRVLGWGPNGEDNFVQAAAFGTGLVGRGWDGLKGIYNKASQTKGGQVAIKIGAGIVGAWGAFKLGGKAIDETFGKIPVIGKLIAGPLKLLAGIVGFLGGGKLVEQFQKPKDIHAQGTGDHAPKTGSAHQKLMLASNEAGAPVLIKIQDHQGQTPGLDIPVFEDVNDEYDFENIQLVYRDARDLREEGSSIYAVQMKMDDGKTYVAQDILSSTDVVGIRGAGNASTPVTGHVPDDVQARMKISADQFRFDTIDHEGTARDSVILRLGDREFHIPTPQTDISELRAG